MLPKQNVRRSQLTSSLKSQQGGFPLQPFNGTASAETFTSLPVEGELC